MAVKRGVLYVKTKVWGTRGIKHTVQDSDVRV
jgi:hypothetical protein